MSASQVLESNANGNTATGTGEPQRLSEMVKPMGESQSLHSESESEFQSDLSCSSSSSSSSSSSPSSSSPSLLNRTRSSINAFLDRPRVIRCSVCSLDLAVPPSVWEWKCDQSHVNDQRSSECSVCGEKRGGSGSMPGLRSWSSPQPQIQCSSCRSWSSVPSSQLLNSISRSMRSLSLSANDAIAPPQSFHCGSCNVLLVNPHERSSWKCPKCPQMNEWDRYACISCSTSKPPAVLICGACSQATAPPSIKLFDRAKSLIRKMSISTEKAFLTGTGTAFVSCPTCDTAVTLPRFHVGGASNTSSAATTPRNSSHGSDQTRVASPSATSVGGNDPAIAIPGLGSGSESAAGGLGSGVGAGSSAPALPRRASWSLDLNCPNCGNNFLLMNEQAAQSNSIPAGATVRRQFLPEETISQIEKAAPQL